MKVFSEGRTSLPNDQIQVCKYYGNERIQDAKALSKHDVVLTTYSTLGTEYVRSQTEHKRYKKGAKCALMHIHWFRIVLDEAHLIRDRKTNMVTHFLKVVFFFFFLFGTNYHYHLNPGFLGKSLLCVASGS